MSSDAPVVSRRKFEQAIERAEKMKGRLDREKKDKAKATQILIRSVGVAGAAGIIGFAEGNAAAPENTEMFGLPLSLVVAAGGTLLNIAGYAGDEQTSSLVQAVADGGFAAYAYGKGREIGAEKKAAA